MLRPPSGADALDHEAFRQARGVFRLRDNPLPHVAVHALAAEVVSRLERRNPVSVDPLPHPEDIGALCDALVSPSEDAAAEMVQQARLDGMNIDAVYLGYLARAAQELGNRWDEDRVTSAQMTIAAGRIYAIMRGLRQAFVTDQVMRPVELRALFASVPGETHTLGVTMAADYFRRRGWLIDLRTGLAHRDLIASVPAESQSVIGLSAGCERMIFPLARLIVALRISNPAAWIMVSGKITDLVPDIVGLVDADAVAGDPETALEQMRAHCHGTPQVAVARN